MEKEVQKIIKKQFKQTEVDRVIEILSSLELKEVWDSAYNLKNCQLSILKLAKGSIDEVTELTKAAKIDFRDVIYWATEQK